MRNNLNRKLKKELLLVLPLKGVHESALKVVYSLVVLCKCLNFWKESCGDFKVFISPSRLGEITKSTMWKIWNAMILGMAIRRVVGRK
jgi:hypothetical protein